MRHDSRIPLKELSFHGNFIDLEWAEIQRPFFHTFTDIPLTTLYLDCIRIINVAIMDDLVDIFPSLKRLIINSARYDLTTVSFTELPFHIQ